MKFSSVYIWGDEIETREVFDTCLSIDFELEKDLKFVNVCFAWTESVGQAFPCNT